VDHVSLDGRGIGETGKHLKAGAFLPKIRFMQPIIIEGLLADVDGVRFGQIVIERGTIAAVGAQFGKPQHVFPESCLIFAGMGDIHIHAREDVTGRQNDKETFATAAAAALNGGVVHVADMPNNPAAPIDEASYAAKETLLARQQLPVVFTLYAGIGPGTRPLRRLVPYKAYMGPSVGDLFFSTLEELDRTLAHYSGKAVSFHCEDPILLEKNKNAPTHETRRPAECELSATRFALTMIEKYGLAGKLCHYSVGEGLPLIRAAKHLGLAVTAEVTPHHVYFDTDQITPANRQALQMNPPLRSPADRTAMLEALRDGTADFLATDHAPHTVAEKLAGVSGQPHLDTFGPFVTWLLLELHAGAHCRRLFGQPGNVRESLSKGKIWQAAAWLCRLAHRVGFKEAGHDQTGEFEDEMPLEPV